MDPKFISPFVHAVKNVMTTMVQLEPAAQAPKLYKKPAPLGEVASVMPMECEQVTGQLVVSFTGSAILDITSRMIMEECKEIDQMVMDCAGEFTNMITGAAKVQLQENGFDFNMNRPSTYVADNFSELKLSGPSRIVIPYCIPSGNFFVDLGFVSTAS
ncbi:chemotaxis protein CheX [Agarilytica rhodophyticola]|uniref:chemotaxis protein CheX n=1 Tax=Agarilytica rhodophyticola TaxID=1737490 RepID=UPI000B3468BE|nr:chemotaxis protein CheX [Agarilytica rhodophyticola]